MLWASGACLDVFLFLTFDVGRPAPSSRENDAAFLCPLHFIFPSFGYDVGRPLTIFFSPLCCGGLFVDGFSSLPQAAGDLGSGLIVFLPGLLCLSLPSCAIETLFPNLGLGLGGLFPR